MKCIVKGHVYEVANRAPEGTAEYDVKCAGATQKLEFVNRQPGQEVPGTTTQEVLRVLIDRTRHCANCMPHPVNEQIIYHLRMALALHEARALERRIEKDGLAIEYAEVDDHGHLCLPNTDPKYLQAVRQDQGEITPDLTAHLMPWEKQPNHPPAPHAACRMHLKRDGVLWGCLECDESWDHRPASCTKGRPVPE